MRKRRAKRNQQRDDCAPPSPAVKRLSLYLRQLEQLDALGVHTVSSDQIAAPLHLAAAQVRKDLAYFGQFGRRGVGYRVKPLAETLRRILGTDKTWNVIVVGAGDLGRALLRYKGFRKRGFNIVAAFDIAREKVGRRVGSVKIHSLGDLTRVVRQHDVKLAVISVPAEAAQQVSDAICRAGVKGILNFAPTTLHVPDGTAVAPVDLAAQLEQLSFRVVASDVPQ